MNSETLRQLNESEENNAAAMDMVVQNEWQRQIDELKARQNQSEADVARYVMDGHERHELMQEIARLKSVVAFLYVEYVAQEVSKGGWLDDDEKQIQKYLDGETGHPEINEIIRQRRNETPSP